MAEYKITCVCVCVCVCVCIDIFIVGWEEGTDTKHFLFPFIPTGCRARQWVGRSQNTRGGGVGVVFSLAVFLGSR